MRRVCAAGAAALCGLALAAGLGGCGGAGTAGCRTGADWAFRCREDSVGLELFASLPAQEQQRRRHAAALKLAEARDAARFDQRLQAGLDAAGLAPDDPWAWLSLAELQRWAGHDLQARESLDNAAAALRRREDAPAADAAASRDQALLAEALLRAWVHYDRAEWRDCLTWARSAADLRAGGEPARQILGLAEARAGNRSRAIAVADELRRSYEFSTDVGWIRGCIETGQGRHREGYNYMLGLRPRGEHRAECWRDMGLIAEEAGEWSMAARWYRESAAALPFSGGPCLQETKHGLLEPGSAASAQPVWLAGGRAYVTGSRSAYTALAYARFAAAADPEEREYWAGAAVNSAGICLRLNVDRPWALRVKGLVFAATGMQERALADLRGAARELGAAGIADAQVEAELGRIFLVREDYDQAQVHLRRSVNLDEGAARPWSDLGLALVRLGDRVGAERALSRALALDPTLATAWYNRGVLNVQLGNLERAQADLVEAARLAPDNQEIIYLLQRVRLNLKERAKK